MPQWGYCDIDNLLPVLVWFWLALAHYDIFLHCILQL